MPYGFQDGAFQKSAFQDALAAIGRALKRLGLGLGFGTRW